MEIDLLRENLKKIIPDNYKLTEISNSGRDGFFKFSNLFGTNVIYIYFSPYKDIKILKTTLFKRQYISYKEKYKIRGDNFSYNIAVKKLILDKVI